ncbi:plasmid partitioning protein RepB [Roseobacter sp.]|uniref:plasmid partitioning protein RepB n=1 Tax=Roseobacter sp. TaxID=1907202 RepID=UPI0025CC1AF6|nr:plasmid partitioning protein RepB [Roseobacter sp.]
MSDSRKKRMAMLDNLTAAQAAPPPASMMSSNRALRSARDAVDAHQVWDLDPWSIEDSRVADRLDPSDVQDLRDAIETNGQTVPVLVRRHPSQADRYLLVYGRRRLEAIRQSDTVKTVRALVANLDDHSAMRAQISENMARRDLSFIEKALFAKELMEAGFGTQTEVAEVLTVSKSAVSMALAVVDSIGVGLIRAIGAAHGVGRPRWEALARVLRETSPAPEPLCDLATGTRSSVEADAVRGADGADPSVAAFEAVARAVEPQEPAAQKRPAKKAPDGRAVMLGGKAAGRVQRSPGGLKLEIKDAAFGAWLDGEIEGVLQELHARYKTHAED